MISNIASDLVMGVGSLTTSGTLSMIAGVISNSNRNRQLMDERTHALTLLAINKDYKDVESTRNLAYTKNNESSRFIAWTRRFLSWAIIAMIMTMLYCSINNIPINVIYSEAHSFLFWHWNTQKALTVHGLPLSAQFWALIFMVFGFYFGSKFGDIIRR